MADQSATQRTEPAEERQHQSAPQTFRACSLRWNNQNDPHEWSHLFEALEALLEDDAQLPPARWFEQESGVTLPAHLAAPPGAGSALALDHVGFVVVENASRSPSDEFLESLTTRHGFAGYRTFPSVVVATRFQRLFPTVPATIQISKATATRGEGQLEVFSIRIDPPVPHERLQQIRRHPALRPHLAFRVSNELHLAELRAHLVRAGLHELSPTPSHNPHERVTTAYFQTNQPEDHQLELCLYDDPGSPAAQPGSNHEG